MLRLRPKRPAGVVPILVATTIALLVSGCAGASDESQSAVERRTIKDGRTFTGTWTARLDAARSVEYKLSGAYQLTSDVADAPAGKTDLYLRTEGLLRFKNASDKGRDTDDSKTIILVLVPAAECPWRRPKGPLRYCQIDLDKANTGGIEAGGASDYVISSYDKLGTIDESALDGVLQAFDDQGIVIATNGVLIETPESALNVACTRNGVHAITYFSENPEVDGCSVLDPD